MIPPIRVREVSDEERKALEKLYHETKDVRIRQRVQIILLALEQGLIAREIALIVRSDDETVRNWLKRAHPFSEWGMCQHLWKIGVKVPGPGTRMSRTMSPSNWTVSDVSSPN